MQISNVCASSFETYESGLTLLNSKYKFVQQIQKGSFGRVSLAFDTVNGCHVALKAMHKSKDVELMARHEIDVLRKLGHANKHICQLLDSFDTADFVVLVLEYCANGDLFDMIHSGSSPSSVEVYNLAKEIHSGLLYCHSLDIYHRDIKPENILFTDSGSVKICDWGLATFNRTSTTFNVGTEKYMAPECFLHTPISSNPSFVVQSYDCKAADYWSVGITLLTAVFGSAPFKPIQSLREDMGTPLDGFKLRGKSVKKSLESDSNFKNFVFYNNTSVLYDIYPDMNETCFNAFMHLLKAGGTEDDLASYHHKCQLRDFDLFIKELGENWKYGLTVWEEEELDINMLESDGAAVDHEESVFDMDDFSTKADSNKEDYTDKSNLKDESLPGHETYFASIPIEPIRLHQAQPSGTPMPSLAESSGTELSQPKSWCDLPDELDDVEFSRMFNSLSFRTGAINQSSNVRTVGSIKRPEIQLVEQELLVNPEPIDWVNY